MKPGIWFLLVAAVVAFGQSGEIERPLLGFVHDPATRRVVVLSGIPSAAVSEPLTEADGTLEFAAGQGFAVALTGSERRAVLISRGAPIQTVIGARDGALHLKAAASGRTAVLVHPDGVVEFLDMNSSPAAVTRLRLTPADASVVAVGPDRIASVSPVAQGISVQSIDGAVQFIPTDAAVTAAAFDAERLLVAAGAKVITFDAGLALVSAVALPRSGATHITPARASRVLAAWSNGDIALAGADRDTATMSCRCRVDGLAPLDGGSAWRLTDLRDGRVRILDLSRPMPTLLFGGDSRTETRP